MSDLIQVDGHPGLARDENTGAIVNINRSSIKAARQAKALRRAKELKEENTENRLAKLEDQMDQMLSILKKMAEDG